MEERVFRRKFYQKMLAWKRDSDGHTALMIKGARRVGKSTIAEEFAKNEYDSYILVDFTRVGPEIPALFDDLSNLGHIFMALQFYFNVTLTPRRSVIILDEIQECPKARQAIKELVKDHRYDYIETGSLISVRRKTQGIRIPSEETRLTMYPMDYEEFRWAMGDDATVGLLAQAFADKQALGDASHRKIMRDLRLYMLIGGMPQAVNTYLDTQNLSLVDAVKRDILELYDEDFYKIDPSGKAASLFKAIPAQLSGNAHRYQLTPVIGEVEDSSLLSLLHEMEESRTVNIAHHVDDPNVGLPMSDKWDSFKMYVGDTGLFITLAFADKDVTDNVIYQKLLSDKLSANLGYVYENMVAQMLTASGNRLFYHTFPDGNKHFYEVDFLLSRKQKICPVEVKSSGYKSHKSLDAFCEKYSDRVLGGYLLYTKDLKRDGALLMSPVYMAQFL
ncbi:MAG: ATP-binding protein [Bacteroidales bacterium]|nr:ATP-binding protein [Bacteroidales bacterium]